MAELPRQHWLRFFLSYFRNALVLLAFVFNAVGLSPQVLADSAESNAYVLRINYQSNLENHPDDQENLKDYKSDAFFEMDAVQAENPMERNKAISWMQKKIKKARQKDPNRPVEVIYFNENTSKYEVESLDEYENKGLLDRGELKTFANLIIDQTPYAKAKELSLPSYIWKKFKEHTTNAVKKTRVKNATIRLALVGAGVTFANAVQASGENIYEPLRVLVSDSLSWGPLLAMGALIGLASSSFILYKEAAYGYMTRSDQLGPAFNLKKYLEDGRESKLRNFVDGVERLLRWGFIEKIFVWVVLAAGMALGLDPTPISEAIAHQQGLPYEIMMLVLKAFVLTLASVFTQGTWETVVSKFFQERAKKVNVNTAKNDNAYDRSLITLSVLSIAVMNLNKGSDPPAIGEHIYMGMGLSGLGAVIAYAAKGWLHTFSWRTLMGLKSAPFYKEKVKSLCQLPFLKKKDRQ